MPNTHPIARWLYNGALWVLTPLYLRRLRRRALKEPAYAERVEERLARPRLDRRFAKPATPDAPRVWLHAVSLGETNAAAPLVAALRARWPAMQLLLTGSTATGMEAGATLLKPGDAQTWLPFDTPSATRRFFEFWQPSIGVVMETEVWPNLMMAARNAEVPMVLANGRLSERSLARGQRWRALLSPALQGFDAVLAQSDADADRFRTAGASRVEVFGNLKFDITPPAKMVAKGLAWRTAGARQIVLMAVSRAGEEAALLQAWRGVSESRPLLLIVPRHPQRFDEVANLVQSQGLRLVRRSQWGDEPSEADRSADVWLGDSMGEMPLYYGMADCALLGGSFEPLGGQNLIEAAACGCPIVMGPHTFNFTEASALALAARAAIRVEDIGDGVHRAVALARDGSRNAWVERAFAFAAHHRGATARTADRIEQMWREASRG